jgi:hypothetical protein
MIKGNVIPPSGQFTIFNSTLKQVLELIQWFLSMTKLFRVLLNC